MSDAAPAGAEGSQAAPGGHVDAPEPSVHSQGPGGHNHHQHQHRAKRHKPEKIDKLHVDGSNWPAWRSRIEGAFVYEGNLHVLEVAEDGHSHHHRDLQNGLQILKENVVDGLLTIISPPGASVAPTPAAAMLRLQQMFGGVQKEIIKQQKRLLTNLIQGPSEDVRAFLRRAQDINDKLILAGGDNPTSTFLDFIKTGLLWQYEVTVDLFEASADCDNLAILTSKLVNQEMRLARHAVQDVAGAAIPTGQQRGQGRGQGRAQGRGQQQGRGRGQQQQQGVGGNKWQSPEYIAAGKIATCFNCGVVGHRVHDCPQQPPTLPLRFVPKDWKPSVFGRGGRGGGAGPAAGAAQPGLNA
jgi:hypothetical protein